MHDQQDSLSIDEIEAQNAELRTQLTALYASSSWKTTAPLRACGSVVWRIRSRLLKAQDCLRTLAYHKLIALDANASIQKSALARNLIESLLALFPETKARIAQQLAALVPVPLPEQPMLVAVDASYAWVPKLTHANRLEHILVLELAHRKNNKRRHQ